MKIQLCECKVKGQMIKTHNANIYMYTQWERAWERGLALGVNSGHGSYSESLPDSSDSVEDTCGQWRREEVRQPCTLPVLRWLTCALVTMLVRYRSLSTHGTTAMPFFALWGEEVCNTRGRRVGGGKSRLTCHPGRAEAGSSSAQS